MSKAVVQFADRNKPTGAEPALDSKIVMIDSRRTQLFGYAADGYFAQFEAHAPNVDTAAIQARRLCDESAVILDIGSNIGATTIAFSRLVPRGRVYAFEPSSQNYSALHRNLVSNDCRNCHAFEAAVGAKSGTARIHEVNHSGAESRIVTGAHEGHAAFSASECRMVTVDDFVTEQKLERVDFIKIDTEGFEIEVLEGMHQTIARFRPVIYIEFNSFTLIACADRSPRELLDKIFALCPVVYCVNRDRSLQPIPNEPQARYNFIHDNLVHHGCVDDLLIAPDRSRFDGAPAVVAERLDHALAERNAVQARLTELESILDSNFWRKTQPLRNAIAWLRGLIRG